MLSDHNTTSSSKCKSKYENFAAKAKYLSDIVFEPQEWVWDKVILKGEVTNIHGLGGTGKSAFVQCLVAALATDVGAVLGHSLDAGHMTLWLDGESGAKTFKRRMTWALNGFGHPWKGDRITYIDLKPGRLSDNKELGEHLQQFIQKRQNWRSIIDSYESNWQWERISDRRLGHKSPARNAEPHYYYH